MAKGVAEDRALLFPNWVDITRLPYGHSTLAAYRSRLNIDADAVVALYSGNMGGKQGLDILASAADLVMPSKLTGMLASGRPVVATAHKVTELATVVAGCGLVVEPEQPQAFADAIVTLAHDSVLRNRLGSAGRLYAEVNLDRDVVLGQVLC